MPDPAKFDDFGDFEDCVMSLMDSGLDEDTATEWCQNMMENMGGKPVIVKTTSSPLSKGMEFVLSDETIDRYGDVIAADGWDITDFKKNPIALFGHRADFPIGTWENVRVDGKALRGHLKMAPEGTSARIDEIRKLIEAGVLKAVSVGFHPIESKPRSREAPGSLYVKSSLAECSLVSIPANPNALAVAKSLKVSADTMDLVFAKQGEKRPALTRSGKPGKQAETLPVKKVNRTMANESIAQRVKDAEQRKVTLRDKLTEHMKTVDDESPTEEQIETTDELTAQIEAAERSIQSLKKVEKAVAITAKTPSEIAEERNGSEQVMEVKNFKPFAVPVQKIRPSDWIWKALTIQVKSQADPRMPIHEIVQRAYPGQERLHDGIHAMHNGLVTRGTTTVANTTTATWAQELVTVGIGDFFDLLQPVSIYAALSALGGRFTFGPNGVVSIPYRTSTATVGGAFVAQGGNIPVKKASFNAINLTPKKVGVISTFTRELAEHSTPSIEALLREAIVNDTATAIDGTLMDNTAATTTRPQGLQNYAGSTQTPTSPGTDLTGPIGDLKVMSNALSAATNGNVRTPVWIMTPGAANCIALSTIAAVGMMPFRDEINAGRWNSWPVIKSTNSIPADTIWLIDAADFVTATGDVPRFTVSDSATIVMDDAPTDPVAAGGTAFAAGGPVKTMFQTDSIAIRMIMDINWAMRRDGVAFFMTGINWSP